MNTPTKITVVRLILTAFILLLFYQKNNRKANNF